MGIAALTALHELAATGAIDVDTSVMYADFVQACLNEAARIALESMMQIEDYEIASVANGRHRNPA